MNVSELKSRVLAGGAISEEEALWLAFEADKQELYAAAGEIRDANTGKVFDTCSIVNARSGRCSENCKWCAQSAHFKTDISHYELIDEKTCTELAQRNAECGIDKFSFVTSGRTLSDANIDKICDYARKIKARTGMNLCASMGLLDKERLMKLKEAGIKRYHCNLETAPSYFGVLCTTHTSADKIATIEAAREVGMEICSGGIIGMGEGMKERIELAFTLKKLEIKSIPINILNPIKGTPLETAPRLSDDEVLTTVALFRFINPDAFLRFAGGRLLIKHIEADAIAAGMNSAILGDMLTTSGAAVMEDIGNLTKLGYTLSVTGDRKNTIDDKR